MGYTDTAKNTMLDALTADGVSLHTADPGANGGSRLGSTQPATFGAASGGVRTLSGDVEISGTASTATPYWGMWSGSTFLGGGSTSGDPGTNAEGVAILKAGTTFDLNL
jgi:hypothetical protein